MLTAEIRRQARAVANQIDGTSRVALLATLARCCRIALSTERALR